MTGAGTASTSDTLPNPGAAGSLRELIECLRLLKIWAGDLSYDEITNRINTAWRTAGRPDAESARRATVVDCFKPGRRRLNADLVLAIVEALHPEAGYAAQWRQALRVVTGEVQAAAQVRVQDVLPDEPIGFTGRSRELRVLRLLPRQGPAGVALIEGMAGVGKTQLAVHAAHEFMRERLFDRVVYVNLRGFHPDPHQPPADPDAVLDGFLRVLGVSGQQIPHRRPARVHLYRSMLAEARVLVILDNAVDAAQVEPLLPQASGCLTIVTSRRRLEARDGWTRLALAAFTREEAIEYLAATASGVPAGDDPDAPDRIAQRCGYLPLALSLVSAQMSAAAGWTLTDHANRLESRRRRGRLDHGVELALALSYERLPAPRRRMLRLLTLHPGQELDARIAAALADVEPAVAAAELGHLGDDHLLQQTASGRFSLHDLTRTFVTERAADEDTPAIQHAASTRLFDYYLEATSAAAAALASGRHPTEADHALRWLDSEHPVLSAIVAQASAGGWHTHAVRLATVLRGYIGREATGSALTLYTHALRAARALNDSRAQTMALTVLGVTELRLGRRRASAAHLRKAITLSRADGDLCAEARALSGLSAMADQRGDYAAAEHLLERAILLYRQAGAREGEAHALTNLALVEQHQGRRLLAQGHIRQALEHHRQAGDRLGEVYALNNLGMIESSMGQPESAAQHHRQALDISRRIRHIRGEAIALSSLGGLLTRPGQTDEAIDLLLEALKLLRRTGELRGQADTLNRLGLAARLADRPDEALTYHTDALAIAENIGAHYATARAHSGLGHTYRGLGQTVLARDHYERAVALYPDMAQVARQVFAEGDESANLRSTSAAATPST